MARGRKPILPRGAFLVINISAFLWAQAYPIGRINACGTSLDSTFECLPTERRITSRNQPSSQKPGNELPQGSWGGEHISLEVKADGAIVEYDCAHGSISRTIILDRHGRFSVPGLYVEEHGGPVREDEQSKSIGVQYSGRVTGKQMYLTVKRRDSGKLIGVFNLVLGQEASLAKCK